MPIDKPNGNINPATPRGPHNDAARQEQPNLSWRQKSQAAFLKMLEQANSNGIEPILDDAHENSKLLENLLELAKCEKLGIVIYHKANAEELKERRERFVTELLENPKLRVQDLTITDKSKLDLARLLFIFPDQAPEILRQWQQESKAGDDYLDRTMILLKITEEQKLAEFPSFIINSSDLSKNLEEFFEELAESLTSKKYPKAKVKEAIKASTSKYLEENYFDYLYNGGHQTPIKDKLRKKLADIMLYNNELAKIIFAKLGDKIDSSKHESIFPEHKSLQGEIKAAIESNPPAFLAKFLLQVFESKEELSCEEQLQLYIESMHVTRTKADFVKRSLNHIASKDNIDESAKVFGQVIWSLIESNRGKIFDILFKSKCSLNEEEFLTLFKLFDASNIYYHKYISSLYLTNKPIELSKALISSLELNDSQLLRAKIDRAIQNCQGDQNLINCLSETIFNYYQVIKHKFSEDSPRAKEAKDHLDKAIKSLEKLGQNRDTESFAHNACMQIENLLSNDACHLSKNEEENQGVIDKVKSLLSHDTDKNKLALRIAMALIGERSDLIKDINDLYDLLHVLKEIHPNKTQDVFTYLNELSYLFDKHADRIHDPLEKAILKEQVITHSIAQYDEKHSQKRLWKAEHDSGFEGFRNQVNLFVDSWAECNSLRARTQRAQTPRLEIQKSLSTKEKTEMRKVLREKLAFYLPLRKANIVQHSFEKDKYDPMLQDIAHEPITKIYASKIFKATLPADYYSPLYARKINLRKFAERIYEASPEDGIILVRKLLDKMDYGLETDPFEMVYEFRTNTLRLEMLEEYDKRLEPSDPKAWSLEDFRSFAKTPFDIATIAANDEKAIETTSKVFKRFFPKEYKSELFEEPIPVHEWLSKLSPVFSYEYTHKLMQEILKGESFKEGELNDEMAYRVYKNYFYLVYEKSGPELKNLLLALANAGYKHEDKIFNAAHKELAEHLNLINEHKISLPTESAVQFYIYLTNKGPSKYGRDYLTNFLDRHLSLDLLKEYCKALNESKAWTKKQLLTDTEHKALNEFFDSSARELSKNRDHLRQLIRFVQQLAKVREQGQEPQLLEFMTKLISQRMISKDEMPEDFILENPKTSNSEVQKRFFEMLSDKSKGIDTLNPGLQTKLKAARKRIEEEGLRNRSLLTGKEKSLLNFVDKFEKTIDNQHKLSKRAEIKAKLISAFEREERAEALASENSIDPKAQAQIKRLKKRAKKDLETCQRLYLQTARQNNMKRYLEAKEGFMNIIREFSSLNPQEQARQGAKLNNLITELQKEHKKFNANNYKSIRKVSIEMALENLTESIGVLNEEDIKRINAHILDNPEVWSRNDFLSTIIAYYNFYGHKGKKEAVQKTLKQLSKCKVESSQDSFGNKFKAFVDDPDLEYKDNPEVFPDPKAVEALGKDFIKRVRRTGADAYRKKFKIVSDNSDLTSQYKTTLTEFQRHFGVLGQNLEESTVSFKKKFAELKDENERAKLDEFLAIYTKIYDTLSKNRKIKSDTVQKLQKNFVALKLDQHEDLLDSPADLLNDFNNFGKLAKHRSKGLKVREVEFGVTVDPITFLLEAQEAYTTCQRLFESTGQNKNGEPLNRFKFPFLMAYAKTKNNLDTRRLLEIARVEGQPDKKAVMVHQFYGGNVMPSYEMNLQIIRWAEAMGIDYVVFNTEELSPQITTQINIKPIKHHSDIYRDGYSDYGSRYSNVLDLKSWRQEVNKINHQYAKNKSQSKEINDNLKNKRINAKRDLLEFNGQKLGPYNYQIKKVFSGIAA